MKHRSGAGSRAPRPQKAARRKRRNAPKTMRDRAVSIVGQETDAAQFIRERDEALERETATSEVLRLISKSPGDPELVFRSILENATRLCEAQFGLLFRYDGRLFNKLAVRNVPAALLDFMEQRGAFLPPAGTALHDLLVTRDVVHRADASAAQTQSAPVRLAGAKSFLTVPMFKDEALVGAISIYRQEVRPFTDKQIELLQNFAAQAVIAIENARLLNELHQRTTDLAASLERQTATSHVLSIISSSPAELEPVFQAILANATRLCSAKFGTLNLYDGEVFHRKASYNVPPEIRRAVAPWKMVAT
jgi:GAF domain-containing protein